MPRSTTKWTLEIMVQEADRADFRLEASEHKSLDAAEAAHRKRTQQVKARGGEVGTVMVYDPNTGRGTHLF